MWELDWSWIILPTQQTPAFSMETPMKVPHTNRSPAVCNMFANELATPLEFPVAMCQQMREM